MIQISISSYKKYTSLSKEFFEVLDQILDWDILTTYFG